jgi:hypothetical protein
MCRYVIDLMSIDQMGTTIVLIEHDMGVVMDLAEPRGGARLRHRRSAMACRRT